LNVDLIALSVNWLRQNKGKVNVQFEKLRQWCKVKKKEGKSAV
jgi:hypothetical protein